MLCRGRVYVGSFIARLGSEVDQVPRTSTASPAARLKLDHRQAVDNNRHFEGRLEKFQGRTSDTGFKRGQPQVAEEDGCDGGEKIEIEFANVEKANLVPEL